MSSNRSAPISPKIPQIIVARASDTEEISYDFVPYFNNYNYSTKRGVPVVASSNALANQLYRSSSYHSSGRSSAGDGEEMYSDSSLEGEVIDLNKKVS
jgi:hypothetical protein